MSALPHRVRRDEGATPEPPPPDGAGGAGTVRAPPGAGVRRPATGERAVASLEPAPGTPRAVRVRELTVRAVLAGAGIGGLLSAGNVYTSLKSTFIDGGALTATLISFAGFGLFRRFLRTPFGPLENNIVQTVAASAAVMAYAHGLMGPIPALELLGQRPAMWAVALWGLGLAAIGILVAVVLRARLIDEDDLPFPSGTATAVLITEIHADHRSAARRSSAMGWTALLAMVVTVLRDGPWSLLPGALYLPITVSGLSASSLTLGLAVSPLMAATGVLVGARTAFTLLAGGLVGWAVLGPAVHHAGWVASLSYADMASWLVWPAIGMMLSGVLVTGVLGFPRLWGLLPRVWQDVRSAFALGAPRPGLAGGNLGLVTAAAGAHRGSALRRWALLPVLLLLPILLAVVGKLGFGYAPAFLGAAVLASLILGGICARAAGETDIAPVGQMGTLVQIAASAGGPTASILSGSVVSGSATQTAQSLWAFRAGRNLGASPRAQIVAQFVGAGVGALVAVPTYVIVTRAYGLGSEQMPAVSALSWKATSLALSGGLSGATGGGRAMAMAIAFALGTALTVLSRRPRWQRIVPSPIALGIGIITPASLSAAAVVGVMLCGLTRRWYARRTSAGFVRDAATASSEAAELDGAFGSAAAGALAGESITGVILAALAACGVM